MIQTNDFENYLKEITKTWVTDETLMEATNYLLLSGGKRLRPLIIFSLLNDFKEDYTRYFPIACALEMVHTYSLIHDDLSIMDNDDYRRGMISTHIKYGDDIALLAGDTLLTHSFEEIIKQSDMEGKLSNILQLFIKCIGANSGMINGQVMDIKNENKQITIEELNLINIQKTSNLFEFAMVAPAILTNKSSIVIEKLREIAIDFGLFFQIQDDYLDRYGTFEETGKPIGSDEQSNKMTYAYFFEKQELEEYLENKYLKLFKDFEKYPTMQEVFSKLRKRID